MTSTSIPPGAAPPSGTQAPPDFESRVAHLQESFGLSLQRVRLARGLSCREVGRLAGLGPGTANRLEMQCAGTIATFLRVAAALNLDEAVDEFFAKLKRPPQASSAGDNIAPALHRSVADAVKRCRLAAHLSQEELALRSGVHVRTIWNVESQCAGTMSSLVRLVQALGLADQLERLLLERARTEPVIPTTVNRPFMSLLNASRESSAY